MVVIIDYGLGNLRSIWFKLKKFGVKAEISSVADVIMKADKLILPGVGAFGQGMEYLHQKNLIPLLNEKVIGQQTPILGICLGMQLMTSHSEEGDVQGLGWIDAETKRFPNLPDLKIPQMGWNSVILQQQNAFTENTKPDHHFYFVHGYYVDCRNREDVMAITHYGIDYTSMFHRNNIYGTQFHPEKSHKHGVELLVNFCKNEKVK